MPGAGALGVPPLWLLSRLVGFLAAWLGLGVGLGLGLGLGVGLGVGSELVRASRSPAVACGSTAPQIEGARVGPVIVRVAPRRAVEVIVVLSDASA